MTSNLNSQLNTERVLHIMQAFESTLQVNAHNVEKFCSMLHQELEYAKVREGLQQHAGTWLELSPPEQEAMRTMVRYLLGYMTGLIATVYAEL